MARMSRSRSLTGMNGFACSLNASRRQLTLKDQMVLHITVKQLTFFFTFSRWVRSAVISVTFMIRGHTSMLVFHHSL